jgi:hypothetical protein
MMTETTQGNGDAGQTLAPVSLLAVLRENAEKHRALLTRLASDPSRRDDVVRLEARASAVFDLLEIIAATERQCAANGEVRHSHPEIKL